MAKIERLKQILKNKNKEIKDNEELLEIAINEHTFANLQLGFWISIIEEIEVLTDDKLLRMIINNARERNAIDKVIHCKKVFNTK